MLRFCRVIGQYFMMMLDRLFRKHALGSTTYIWNEPLNQHFSDIHIIFLIILIFFFFTVPTYIYSIHKWLNLTTSLCSALAPLLIWFTKSSLGSSAFQNSDIVEDVIADSSLRLFECFNFLRVDG